jgi:hypothetical protein
LGRKKKEKKNEGTEERVFEKRERFWKKQRWMNWGFGGEKAKKKTEDREERNIKKKKERGKTERKIFGRSWQGTKKTG